MLINYPLLIVPRCCNGALCFQTTGLLVVPGVPGLIYFSSETSEAGKNYSSHICVNLNILSYIKKKNKNKKKS